MQLKLNRRWKRLLIFWLGSVWGAIALDYGETLYSWYIELAVSIGVIILCYGAVMWIDSLKEPDVK